MKLSIALRAKNTLHNLMAWYVRFSFIHRQFAALSHDTAQYLWVFNKSISFSKRLSNSEFFFFSICVWILAWNSIIWEGRKGKCHTKYTTTTTLESRNEIHNTRHSSTTLKNFVWFKSKKCFFQPRYNIKLVVHRKRNAISVLYVCIATSSSASAV